ncbi:MAG: SGNH/GDSL hydrolase family protein [Candidatus Latescibacteria bacterium]|nr:SGNH/GDSL hydrolase family protein [Candidatus Latescibacterota bacterium]
MAHRKFLDYYRNTALFILNLVVLLVIVNAALYVMFRVNDARTHVSEAERIARIHNNPELRRVYPDLDAQSIHQLMQETWSRAYGYEPFTQFRERPFTGRFVNVSEAGYRLSKNQGPWPPDPENYNVFVFGGSTTFGYGLPDSQTVASYLQDYLAAHASADVRIYNFGRGSYVSEQERVLFEELLLSGLVPDLALFIDGLNEFAFPAGPAETERLKALFGAPASTLDRWRWIQRLPMTRLARYMRRSATAALTSGPRIDRRNLEPTAAFDDGKYRDPEVIARVIERYFQNKDLIGAVADSRGVSAVFVWQPIPLYKYDLNYHLFARSDFGSNFFARYGYAYVARRIAQDPPGRSFLWCADIQESLKEPLYVDKVHYTARMSRLFAATIAEQMLERGLIPVHTAHTPRG